MTACKDAQISKPVARMCNFVAWHCCQHVVKLQSREQCFDGSDVSHWPHCLQTRALQPKSASEIRQLSSVQVMVLVSSAIFIVVVICLHVIGKVCPLQMVKKHCYEFVLLVRELLHLLHACSGMAIGLSAHVHAAVHVSLRVGMQASGKRK